MTLVLEEELGLEELEQVGEELFRLMHRGRTRVVLDLSEVPHLDYRGVRPLVARAERFRQAGGDIKLCGLSPYLAAIFRAAGAHQAFECYATRAEAQAAFLPGAESLRPWR
jgi:anti-anti-sigma factor